MKKLILIFGIILLSLVGYSQATKNISSTGGNLVKKDAQGNVIIGGSITIGIPGQIIPVSDSGVTAEVIYAYIGIDWTTWSPSLSWTGTAPTVNSSVYRYTKIRDLIHFSIGINFTTAGGGGVTALNITLPETPKDVNLLNMCTGTGYFGNAFPPIDSDYIIYIDSQDNTGSNRKLYLLNLTSAVSTNYDIWITGYYETEN